jgi:hypothetical protein
MRFTTGEWRRKFLDAAICGERRYRGVRGDERGITTRRRDAREMRRR